MNKGLVLVLVFTWVVLYLVDGKTTIASIMEKGQDALEKDFGGRLPSVISGGNFTRANLEKYFSIVDTGSIVDDGNTTTSLRGNEGLRALSSAEHPLFLFCKVACERILKMSQNEDQYDMQLLDARALPKDVPWHDISGWSKRKLEGGHWVWKNGFGVHVIEVWFHWEFHYGGKANERGAYISYASSVVSVQNAFLFSADFSTRAYNLQNAGTTTGPIGSIDIQIVIDTDHFINSQKHTVTATVRGDGSASSSAGSYLSRDESINAEPPTASPTASPSAGIVTAGDNEKAGGLSTPQIAEADGVGIAMVVGIIAGGAFVVLAGVALVLRAAPREPSRAKVLANSPK